MIELFRRLIILRKICKKYGIKLRLYLHEGYGSFNYRLWKFEDCSIIFDSDITVCLWDSRLWEIFYHELGHLINARATQGYTEGLYANHNLSVGDPVTNKAINYMKRRGKKDQAQLLICEAVASRIAVKFLESSGTITKNSVPYLSRCLGSYTSGVNKQHLADVDYKLNRYIKGEVGLKL